MSAVIADEIGTERPSADGHVDPVGALHDVEVRQHLAAGIEHDAGPDADRTLILDHGVDAGHGRLDLSCRRERIGGRGCRGRRVHRRDQSQDRGKSDQARRQSATRVVFAHVFILAGRSTDVDATGYSQLRRPIT